MSMKFEDYYKTLDVERKASAEEIKRAYRKLATRYHPDKNKDDPKAAEKFSKVNEAYEVLCDPDKRKKYNTLGANWKHGQAFEPPSGFGSHYRPGQGGFSFESSDNGSFSDFFETLFGQHGASTGTSAGGPAGFDQRFNQAGGRSQSFGASPPSPPREQEIELKITFAEAFHGGTRQLRLQGGGGGDKKVDVKIPKGAATGTKLRLKSEGLLLRLVVASDPRFELSGRNLVTTIALPVWDAALGAKVDVPTMDGPVTMTIPPGTSSGSKLRLKGKGMPPRKPSESEGDLLVKIMVQVPKDLTDAQRDLFEKLRDQEQSRATD